MKHLTILFFCVCLTAACSSSSGGGSSTGDTTGTEGDTTGTEGDTTGSDSCELVDKNACLSNEDCQNTGGYCMAPGSQPGCGACFSEPDECNSDSDCKTQGEHFVCNADPCACGDSEGDGKKCSAGCQADSDCGAWQSCSSGRCIGKKCGEPGDECPPNFFCGEFGCQRSSCAEGGGDSGSTTGGGPTLDKCPVGCCVIGKCHATPGICELPVP